MHPADDLVYRLTARQKRAQRIVAAVFALVTLVFAALAAAGVKAGRSGFLFWLAAPMTLIFVYMALNNTRLFTECTPAGLRARTKVWPGAEVPVAAGRGHHGEGRVRQGFVQEGGYRDHREAPDPSRLAHGQHHAG